MRNGSGGNGGGKNSVKLSYGDQSAEVDYLYYVRKPNSLRHFFTADEEEFCRKAREYGYGC